MQQAIGYSIIICLLGLCGTTYNNFRQKPLWEKLDNATSSEVKFLFYPLFRLEWLFDKSKASHFNVEA